MKKPQTSAPKFLIMFTMVFLPYASYADPVSQTPFGDPLTENQFTGTTGSSSSLGASSSASSLSASSSSSSSSTSSLLATTATTSGTSTCSPGTVNLYARQALHDILDGTAADLDGPTDRSAWFSTYTGLQEFPSGAEVSGAFYRYNEYGTVGTLMSTSLVPLYENTGSQPASEGDCEDIALDFLDEWGDLILLEERLYELELEKVIYDSAMNWKVTFRQYYDDVEVLGGEVAIWGDYTGDVFGMQSFYVLTKITLSV